MCRHTYACLITTTSVSQVLSMQTTHVEPEASYGIAGKHARPQDKGRAMRTRLHGRRLQRRQAQRARQDAVQHDRQAGQPIHLHDTVGSG